ncbi:MAG: hypothetical protein HC794_09345 [Nitrospiraceae bacterium]|nr:hypothetical protein [Nitrospiraceae bacterium]
MSDNVVEFPKSKREVEPDELFASITADDIEHAIVAVITKTGVTRIGITSSPTAIVCYLLHSLRMSVDDLMQESKS